MVTPHVRREEIRQVIEGHGLSERRACGLIGMSRMGFRLADGPYRNAWLRTRLRELTAWRRRVGVPRFSGMATANLLTYAAHAPDELDQAERHENFQRRSDHFRLDRAILPDAAS